MIVYCQLHWSAVRIRSIAIEFPKDTGCYIPPLHPPLARGGRGGARVGQPRVAAGDARRVPPPPRPPPGGGGGGGGSRFGKPRIMSSVCGLLAWRSIDRSAKLK